MCVNVKELEIRVTNEIMNHHEHDYCKHEVNIKDGTRKFEVNFYKIFIHVTMVIKSEIIIQIR